MKYEPTRIQPNCLVAKLTNLSGIVRDDKNGATFGLELGDAFETFSLKRVVADRQDFVDQQYFWSCMDGDRKAQAHLHSGAVGADGVVDERLKLRKGDDRIKPSATSRRVRPLMTPLTNTFSRPVRSGWKPVPKSKSPLIR